MTRSPQSKNISEDTSDGAVFAAVDWSLEPLRAAQDGAKRLHTVATQWQNASQEQLAGRLAEELHASSFNIDAAAKGANLRAATGAANGSGTAAADVTITNAGKIVDQAQIKYHGSAARTTFEVARTKYDGMQRVVPSDQVSKVRDLAQKRGIDGLGQRNYPEVARNTTDRLRVVGVESKPLSRADAIEAAKNPGETGAQLVRGQMVRAVKNGALVGAAVGGGVSAISNGIAFAKGKKSGGDAVVDTLKDTAGCAASGAAVSGVAVATETLLLRAGASVLAGGAAPVAIGLTVVNVGKDVGRLVKGEIDGKAFAGKTGLNVVKGGITWGAMEGGAALGTLIFPGVGTVVGGIVGGIAGALFGGWITK